MSSSSGFSVDVSTHQAIIQTYNNALFASGPGPGNPMENDTQLCPSSPGCPITLYIFV